MNIKATWGASVSQGTHEFSLGDLNHTEDTWNELSEEEQKEVVQGAVEELPDTCTPIVERVEES